MELNLLTTKLGKESYKAIQITELEFWQTYLFFLNLRSSFWINQKEIQVFSWVLSQDPDISWFSSPHSKQMKEAINKLSDAEITRIRERLLELNLVEQYPNPDDMRKKVTLPVPALRKFQKFIKKEKKVTFIFPYEIA